MYFIREVIPGALILSLSNMARVPIQLFLSNNILNLINGLQNYTKSFG